MDRRGKAVSVKKGPPKLRASLVYPPLPTISPRPSKDTVNERTRCVCLGLRVFVQETVRNPGLTLVCQSEGKLNLCSRMTKEAIF